MDAFEQPASLDGDPEWKFHPAKFFDKVLAKAGRRCTCTTSTAMAATT